MGKALTFFCGLGIGAGVGGGVGFLIARKMSEKQVTEEVESVKASYRKAREEYLIRQKEDEEAEKLYENAKEAIKKYVAENKAPDLKQEKAPKMDVHIISPMEFNEIDKEYASVEYFYYADGVIAQSGMPPVTLDDIDMAFGREMLTHLGEDTYGDTDAIYIRREDNRTDYAVYLDGRKWNTDVAPKEIKPLQN